MNMKGIFTRTRQPKMVVLAADEAHEMAHECAYGLAKRAYRVPEATYVTR